MLTQKTHGKLHTFATKTNLKTMFTIKEFVSDVVHSLYPIRI